MFTPFGSLVFSNNTQLHCLGNGRYCVYEQGVNIESIFGPSYSSPSYFQLNLINDFSVSSSRIKGTAIWEHIITKDEKLIAKVTDFVDAQSPTFVRLIDAYSDFSFNMNILENNKSINIVENNIKVSGEITSSTLIHKKRGLFVYSDYLHPYEQFHQLVSKGKSYLKKVDNDNYKFMISPGRSEILFIGGPSLKEVTLFTNQILSVSSLELYNRTKIFWNEFSNKRINFDKTFPKNLPHREQILDQIDNVAIIMKTQQSSEGAVLAGHRYHLGYVRDQYGVSRGFLAMGYYEEARKILEFYWNIWKMFGYIHNAQAISIPGLFHVHENDEVELTGYLIIQSFDYLQKTNDLDFVRKIFPMLEWAWKVQKRNLINYMLPFNGDETYVAGGILPRTALNDGSSESTLLFIEAGEKLLPFIKNNKFWDKESIQKDETILNETRSSFSKNFIIDKKIVANNPDRMTIEEMPMFRNGVCASGNHGVQETIRDKNGNYLCTLCLSEEVKFPQIFRETYFLPSLALTPYYLGVTFLPNNILKYNLSLIKNHYSKTGQISSRDDKNLVIGYEYGYLLYALTLEKEELSDIVLKDMLSVVDEVGAWVEYYDKGNPMGCNYRPWESAINIESIILYSLNYRGLL